jgi:integrase
LISTWLAGDSTLDADTAKVWETYGRHWLAHWPTLADVIDVTCDDYRSARLRKVQGTTVRKELGALRRFLKWCEARGFMPRAVVVPGVNAKTLGTNFGKRRRQKAADLSPDEIQKLIAALPPWSTSGKVKHFPIRARFLVQYETGLRPSTISALSVPEHYLHGANELNITADIDKGRWARSVPLSPAAREALDAVCPPNGGLIFGDHDYREHVAAAAAQALPKAVADRFCGAHLRSARTTHLLEETGNLAGVQFLVGHRKDETTSLYLRPSERAARAALDAFGGETPNTGGSGRSDKRRSPRGTERFRGLQSVRRRGLEPPWE